MKNVTVTMDDAVAEWVRVEAARRGTSVSRMLGEWLAEKMRQEDTYAQAMREALAFETWGAAARPYLARPELMEREEPPAP
ncbi:CopG family transcriptional regulator [Acidovorax sp. NCPPB 3859]|nr:MULTISPECIES: CopG family transcriptional regulator [unclassified Acidovorax]MDA8448586.1 CopG family transcriptional regulator [Acidovorax sp. GBBC 3297]MDA8458295.1 CopG family transcriptional regulator [Acidovorax sp. GBBC 3333]MDA8463333.1 CopG family transcriptional regulator [Acidovorax sp. GBBC 3332]MDA8468062.1 CopG family transcriptional regulator [Acidovorax sp. GBBC 3299]WCM79671.1 CopG family transcriptional regulator [Acidovorax sp. GBBC 712]